MGLLLLLLPFQVLALPLLLLHRSLLERAIAQFIRVFCEPLLFSFSLSSPHPIVRFYRPNRDSGLPVPMDAGELGALVGGGSSILISNHIGAVDSFLLNCIAREAGDVGVLKFIVKDSIKWIPVFGWAMYMAGFLFIKRSWETDMERIRRWCYRAKLSKQKRILVIYPEGTRCTRKKLEKSREFCRRSGLAELDNVLYPRTKGFKLCFNSLQNSAFDSIIHATIVYVENGQKAAAPSLLAGLFWEIRGVFRVLVEGEQMHSVADPEAYLKDLFARKDKEINRLAELKH